MKELHYNIYNDGNVGMCNILMSIENAIIIAKLTNRDIIYFYSDKPVYTYGATSDKNIFDLFDINFNYVHVNSNTITEPCEEIPYNFHDSVISLEDIPTPDFKNGRQNVIYLYSLKDKQKIKTKDNKTLCFYSYLFYLNKDRKEIFDFVKNAIKPKKKYLDAAIGYRNSLLSVCPEGYNALAVRRGDYLFIQGATNKNYSAQDILNRISFKNNRCLCIISDEKDTSFFKPISDVYPCYFINNLISEYNPEFNGVENGLVQLLVGSFSEDFIGTIRSTFTSYIQRYRIYNGKEERFRFIYTTSEETALTENVMNESIDFGEQTWNRIKMSQEDKRICFWLREWPECYPQPKLCVKQSVVINGKFLSKKECEYIISLFDDNSSEHYQYANRNRKVVSIRNNSKLFEIVSRSCEELGYDINLVEDGLQIFKQFESGATSSHVDSIFQDSKGRRKSSVLFYLNDDFVGSDIHFPNLDLIVKPHEGLMIKFPIINEYNEQSKDYEHFTTEIVSGSKIMSYYSLKEN